MTENIVNFFLVAVWEIAMTGAFLYAMACTIAILQKTSFIGGLIVIIILFVSICNVINILKRVCK